MKVCSVAATVPGRSRVEKRRELVAFLICVNVLRCAPLQARPSFHRQKRFRESAYVRIPALAEREVCSKARPMSFWRLAEMLLFAAPATAQTGLAAARLEADQSHCHSHKWLALECRFTLAVIYFLRDFLVQV